MHKKSTSQSPFFNLRPLIALLFCAAVACSILNVPLLGFFQPETASNVPDRTLTFAERVAYQWAIEDVYWRHRIWPKENLEPKPSLDKVMSAQQIENKVEDYLRDLQALEVNSQRPITPEQLQAETERMARDTKQPEVLRELFEALGNDPFLIAECLAKQVLSERLVAELSAHDNGQRFAFLRTQAAGKFGITTLANPAYTLPEINPCTGDTWTATSTTNAPTPRSGHTAVWTGTEMIVWGGFGGSSYLNTGGRYKPSTDSWTTTSTNNAPSVRYYHTAVWTGSEMIAWGGWDNSALNTGGRYNPSTNSWTTTGTTNAPSARYVHTAVWTGSEMIVWGGKDSSENFVNTGGRYKPSTNTWTATSTTNAPSGRDSHTAVWSDSEMIIWGGFHPSSILLNTGGRYNPGTDNWAAISTTNAPSARSSHTAVWTGSEIIVWGGTDGSNWVNTGGKYDPSTNSWTATSTTNAPSGRQQHAAVWTGSEMIVWGGYAGGSSELNTGGRYNPGMNSWTATSIANVPSARVPNDTAVWTGNEMIIWGGFVSQPPYDLNTGGRYCVQSGPTPTPTPAVTTNPATNIASFSATLNGSLNPRGTSTTVYFQYGLTTSYGSTTPMQTQTGNTARPISANISGLMASHVYHFRMVARNGGGTRLGGDRTFTTLSATGSPVVTTNPATLIASFSATLNGSVDPHGLTTSVHFQYGPTASYGFTTAPQSQSGNTYRNVSANISGLTASTTYHFRTVATNSAGTRYGSDRTFTTLTATGPPVVTTNPPTNVTSSSATLNGSLDPHGLNTAFYFHYGITTSYGHVTDLQLRTGNRYQNVSANIAGLSAHNTYHFRIVATNSAGTRYGSDRTFTTQ
jgi:N-acetylneuraminic acid mutarotase